MPEDSGPDIMGQLTAIRGRGQAAEGMISDELDGTSDLVDLIIEPKAMRLPSQDLVAAIKEAFAAARESTSAQLQDAVPTAAAGENEITEQLSAIGFDAQRRLGELTTIAQELSARLDRLG